MEVAPRCLPAGELAYRQGTQKTLVGLCVCMFIGLLCTVFVPETKGRTLEEIWAERDGMVSCTGFIHRSGHLQRTVWRNREGKEALLVSPWPLLINLDCAPMASGSNSSCAAKSQVLENPRRHEAATRLPSLLYVTAGWRCGGDPEALE